MTCDFELGYTPANLKKLRHQHDLTSKNVAEITGVTHAAAQKWEASPAQSSYANMAHTKWLMLLQYIDNKSLPVQKAV